MKLAYDTAPELPSSWDRPCIEAQMLRGWLCTQAGRASRECYVTSPGGSAIAIFLLWRGDESYRAYLQVLVTKGISLPALTCVCPGTEAPGFAWRPGSEVNGQWLLDEGMRLARKLEASSLSFWNLNDTCQSRVCRLLTQGGFDSSPIANETLLDLEGMHCFEDYLASLSTNTRHAVRREMRRFTEAGVSISRCSASRLSEDLVELQVHQHRRYGLPDDRPSIRKKHANLRRYLADHVTVLVAGEPPVGYVVCLLSATSCAVVLGGIADHAPPFTYFNLLFYAVIELCLERDVKRIRFGAESYEAKRRRGCQVLPLELYVRSVPSVSIDTKAKEHLHDEANHDPR